MQTKMQGPRETVPLVAVMSGLRSSILVTLNESREAVGQGGPHTGSGVVALWKNRGLLSTIHRNLW